MHTGTNYHKTIAIFVTGTGHFKKKCALNLVLWLAKPPSFMTMLNITLKRQHDMTGLNTINWENIQDRETHK